MINKISNGSVSGRLYGLDLSRCILLLLGYFFHSYMFYRGVMNFYHQPQFIASMLQSDFLNQLMWRIIVWVHLFRMPAFFVIAGFFAQVIYKKYNSSGFILNRLKRILLPLLIVLVMINTSALSLVIQYFSGRQGLLAPLKAMHLSQLVLADSYWFLTFLFFMELFFCVFKFFNRNSLHEKSRLRLCLFITLILLSCVFLIIRGVWLFSVPYEINLSSDFLDFLFYSCFFFSGAILNKKLLFVFVNNKKTLYFLLVASLVTTSLYFLIMYYSGAYSMWAANFMHALSAWSNAFLILVISNIICNYPNKIIRYLSEASYFLYLVQMASIRLCVISLSGIQKISVRYTLVCFLSFFISILFYHFFVRKRKWLAYVDGAKR